MSEKPATVDERQSSQGSIQKLDVPSVKASSQVVEDAPAEPEPPAEVIAEMAVQTSSKTLPYAAAELSQEDRSVKHLTPGVRRSQGSSRLRNKRHTATYTGATAQHVVTPAIFQTTGQQMNGSMISSRTPSGPNSRLGRHAPRPFMVDAGTNPT